MILHSSASGASLPTEGETWTVGQHPAVSNGWIVRPVLFGSRIRVLSEWEGGHVLLKSEADALLIAAAPDMLVALMGVEDILCEAESRAAQRWDKESPHCAWRPGLLREVNEIYQACSLVRAAITKAVGKPTAVESVSVGTKGEARSEPNTTTEQGTER